MYDPSADLRDVVNVLEDIREILREEVIARGLRIEKLQTRIARRRRQLKAMTTEKEAYRCAMEKLLRERLGVPWGEEQK